MSEPAKPRSHSAALDASQLYRGCDPDQFSFATTADLDEIVSAVGQDRALASLDFAIKMAGDGYNLFVLGPSGSHKHEFVRDYLEQESGLRDVPADWCYLNNFQDPRKPLAVRLPAGRGSRFREDMAQLIADLREVIPATFESEHYRNRVAEINQQFEDRHKAAIEELQERARELGLSVQPTPHGFAIAPVRKGRILADEEFDRLPEEEKKKTNEAIADLTDRLRRHFQSIPTWQKEHRELIRKLNREVIELAAGRLIDQLAAEYNDCEELRPYMDSMREDVLENAQDFQRSGTEGEGLPFAPPPPSLNRYEVNVVVTNDPDAGAPIVYEQNPSMQNLLGRIEHVSQFGALTTDFTMIRPGALHVANGGYLIMDADRVLTEPYAWTALKRALFAKEIRIESLGQLLSIVSTVSLEPEPIPVDLKVVLIGERRIYYLLCELDPDFAQLFKVPADFEDRIDRTPENIALYSRLIATLARNEDLRPIERAAVARVIEESARFVRDNEKLSTRLRNVTDLLREADYWAGQDKHETIAVGHVQQAIDAQIHRIDRIRSHLQEEIQRNTILIDTEGARKGQVNGLSVLKIGNFSFGQPARITATVRVGEGKIIDIERETELGGPIHSKGVLILTSYLASKYAAEAPVSFNASLVFEQSYSGVEGDSASVAETCALVSSLSGLPVDQSLAVTGSINQHGDIQVIGGVNEKIEGFYDVCKARGLNGKQGVLIPKDNVKHLMLRADVVQSVEAKEFNVYAISHIDDAVELLMGTAAGKRDADGRFPEGTVNALTEARLVELAEMRREFNRAGDDGQTPSDKKGSDADVQEDAT